MPHERLKEENQKRVLEKAIEICAEKGMEQMSVAEVAKKAHVSIRSFYRYYESKDALVRMIVEVSIDNMKKALLEVMNSNAYLELDGAKRVMLLARTLLVYAKENCELQSKLVTAELYLYEIGIADAFSLFDNTDNIITKWFQDAFRTGVEDGSIAHRALNDERRYNAMAITFRGFYNRISIISANSAMREHYNPDYLIEDFIAAIYRSISE